MSPQSSFYCPMCTYTLETAFHFVTCNNDPLHLHLKPYRQMIWDIMHKYNTYKGFQALLLHVLKYCHPSNFCFNKLHTTVKSLLLQYIDEQNKLRWVPFMKGFWHHSWFQLQQQHSQYLNKKFHSLLWGKNIIKILHQYVWRCWNFRNDSLHKPTDQSLHKRNDLELKVKALYNDKVR